MLVHNDELCTRQQISAKVDEIIHEDIDSIKHLDSEAIIGYRGSLATGTKFKNTFSGYRFEREKLFTSQEYYSKIYSSKNHILS